MRVVLDVTVLVSFSSVVTEFCDLCPFALIENLWNRSPFLCPKKRALCLTSTQEEMRYEVSQVKASPITRRRMTPPAPMQNSYTSSEREQGCNEEEGRGWNARERTNIARMKQYLERSFSVKVRVEELEGLLGPEEVDVDFRRIVKRSKRRKRAQDFRNFQLE